MNANLSIQISQQQRMLECFKEAFITVNPTEFDWNFGFPLFTFYFLFWFVSSELQINGLMSY